MVKSFCTTEIIFSNQMELESKLLNTTLHHVVLLLTKSAANRWNLNDFIQRLEQQCINNNSSFIWINKISSNPTQKNLLEALHKIGNKKIQQIIAFGGGSSLDLAKGISAFHNQQNNLNYSIESITESIKNGGYKQNSFTSIIAIPSTAGTGSEVTSWATIWDINGKSKYSIDSPGLKPVQAYIVPELTLSLSPLITLSTGLDAMCQAVESYWSKHTTPLVQDIAYRAIDIIINNLKHAIDHPREIKYRKKLCQGSLLAGLAFSQTRTTACHSISYPLTMLFDIPHGLAASITLDEVSKINQGHFENTDEFFHLFKDYGNIKNYIDHVSNGIVIMKLSSFGVIETDIPKIVEGAFTAGRMDNNPINLTEDDVKNILYHIL